MPLHNLGQLVREDNVPKNQTYVYTYDNSGNLTSKKIYSLTAQSSTPSGTYTTKSYSYSTGTWGDLLTSFDGGSITYDTIGNPTKYYDGKRFTWEGRRLVGAVNGSKTMSFIYNDEGIRTSKTVAGVTTNYYYNGSQLIAEETSGNVTVYLYNNTGIIGFQYHGSSYSSSTWDTYFFEKNLQGDVVAVYTSLGTKKISYTYDAWGNFTATYHNGASASTLNNAITYRGYYYDKDLGLYYLNSRYYDSNTGRFINADGLLDTSTILGYNLFAYCANNPIMFVDPNGDFLRAGALIAGILTCFVGAIAITALTMLAVEVVSDAVEVITDAISETVESIQNISNAKEDAKEEDKEVVVTIPPKNQAYFTENPHDFIPRGLEKVEYPGTKNGAIIKWKIPNTKITVFEWDEDYSFGPHYHIVIDNVHSKEHLKPNDPVPEPWNSIYFGG